MKASTSHPVIKLTREASSASARELVSEVPVSLTFNGVAHVVMMMSPRDLEDFALGFSLTEQIIKRPGDLENLEVRPVEDGILIQATIPKAQHHHLLEGRRNMVGQTGCGICGVVELEHAIRPVPQLNARPKASQQALFKSLQSIAALQELNQATGAAHAAALVSDKGQIITLREDVGRHNALDKLIGHIHRNHLPPDEGFVLLTSRCSHELVQKAIILGTPLLVAISAPTSLAIELAIKSGLTLVALARPDAMLCFNDPHGVFNRKD
ncbi:formate dehydrogenase accessory sulfurtransferase FdhD [bacterium AH-315-P15]|nr:formate dehydrogenase accessory sulfurtransferase FdhD [bacterium AH-315-P15]